MKQFLFSDLALILKVTAVLEKKLKVVIFHYSL